MLDVENDGLPDLFVANGHVDDRPWAGHPMAQRPTLYRSTRPAGSSSPPSRPARISPARSVGRGATAGDLDGDGRVDLVVVHRDAPAAVLRNRTEARATARPPARRRREGQDGRRRPGHDPGRRPV